VPLLVTWVDCHARTVTERAATESINCHGFRFFSRERPQKNTTVTFHIIAKKKDDEHADSPVYAGRVAWIRKSRRLGGLFLVGIELGIPLNIWDINAVPEDWAAFSPPTKEDPSFLLAEVDRILHSARTATYYQLLDVESSTPRSELKRHFYQLARRFHPDHHMDHPEWTPRLLALMDSLTTAYKTLSDEETKNEYDSLLARESKEEPSDSGRLTHGFLEKAQECMAEKNFAGCILWLRRAIENEPDSSSHRAMLGRCLSAIPEYRREAVEQFEMALELDSRNLNAHIHYGELLELLNVPWRARSHYLRVLELDENHRGAREHLNRLGPGTPRATSRPSLLGRLRGHR
jgi:curved DNA-binding protein CbpA